MLAAKSMASFLLKEKGSLSKNALAVCQLHWLVLAILKT